MGKPVADEILGRVRGLVAQSAARGRRPPHLAVVYVGDDPASAVYIRQKQRAAAKVGIETNLQHLPATVGIGDLLAIIDRLNGDPGVDAILVQMPLPAGLDPDLVLERVRADKDADGLHPLNLGRLLAGGRGPRPCTPAGVMALLAHYGQETAGRRALVIGRSRLVGWPVAILLTQAQATVTVAHSRTRDLPRLLAEAEIVVAAAGHPGLVEARHVALGAVVVDVGITRTEEGLRGDVDPGVAERAAALSPVPGGVGPLTVAMLLSNTWEAYSRAL